MKRACGHVKAFWRRYVAVFAVAVAAIIYSQPDVPVRYPPAYRHVTNTLIELTEPYSVTTSVAIVDIRPGFRMDGASIPERAWGLIGLNPLSGCIIRGAAGHDALYAAHLTTRIDADALLLEALLADGVQRHKAEIIYQMVRDFGAGPWERTPLEIADARRYVSIRETRP